MAQVREASGPWTLSAMCPVKTFSVPLEGILCLGEFAQLLWPLEPQEGWPRREFVPYLLLILPPPNLGKIRRVVPTIRQGMGCICP